ncbi:MAG: PDDEXK nuclease domain-containing protein [Spirochaetaceae bacterium]|jgi:predicted nuclease of restriction endonuclease-like (RecB) superfamily|nr:PDDEXK nuclease domain-containing protein [Spirochaetaceae bacterium]
MLMNNPEYFDVLKRVKEQIKAAQYAAVLGANVEMLTLYWNIGKVIIGNIEWGNKFVENLSRDIKAEFPKAKGYSIRNLTYMRKFAETYPDVSILQHTVAKLPWRNNITLMDKIKDKEKRNWYIRKNLENGWNNVVLTHQIELGLYERQAIAEKVNNFEKTLPSPQSELAEETMKDPYIFDFVEANENKIEREIESELVSNIAHFLLELGSGFAFVGNQYHLEVGGQDFYIDLLFYHLNLRCYIVVELKNTAFKPEYTGQLNFYLSAVDNTLRKAGDNRTIGLLLCKEKNNIIVEYALQEINRPIGVSEYQLTEYLPKELENALPSVEDIEKRVRAKYELSDEGENNVNQYP